MNKVCILVICMVSLLLLPLKGVAQESQTAYNFLRLPVSARAAAVGGDGIALIEDDASLIFHNPALLSSVSDKQLALNFMTYMAGSTTASASFNRAVGERATWAVSGQFMNYGTMKQTDASGQQTGDFSAKDIAMAGYFSYMLSDRIAGGVTAKVVSSFIGDYSSWGVAFDLGLNYYNPESEFSASIVPRTSADRPRRMRKTMTRCLSTFRWACRRKSAIRRSAYPSQWATSHTGTIALPTTSRWAWTPRCHSRCG